LEREKRLRRKNNMVCELKIKQLEKNLGRKLSDEEKKKIREKMGHVEIDDEENVREEIEIAA
jgi:hypothetical protein